MQTFDTQIGISAGSNTNGQTVDFDGNSVMGLTLTNTTAESVQYTIDGGSNWITVAAAGSATPAIQSPDRFRLRRGSVGAYPLTVRLQWMAASTPFPIVLGDVAPNNSDGRPNGTVYILVA